MSAAMHHIGIYLCSVMWEVVEPQSGDLMLGGKHVVELHSVHEEAGRLQVFMRLQWERQVVRGQSMRLEVKLEGLGVSVMGGLQDELFNLTMDKIEVA